MEVAAHTQLGHLNFARPKNLARSADGVVFRVMEVVDVIDIGADFGRNELGIESRRFGPRGAVQPSPVRECERFSFLRFVGRGSLQLRVFHLWD